MGDFAIAFVGLLLFARFAGSSLWAGDGVAFLLALSLLITDILIMGVTAFGIWDDTEGDKTKISDNDNSNLL